MAGADVLDLSVRVQPPIVDSARVLCHGFADVFGVSANV